MSENPNAAATQEEDTIPAEVRKVLTFAIEKGGNVFHFEPTEMSGRSADGGYYPFLKDSAPASEYEKLFGADAIRSWVRAGARKTIQSYTTRATNQDGEFLLEVFEKQVQEGKVHRVTIDDLDEERRDVILQMKAIFDEFKTNPASATPDNLAKAGALMTRVTEIDNAIRSKRKSKSSE